LPKVFEIKKRGVWTRENKNRIFVSMQVFLKYYF
jgi:hypothetical protein